MRTCTHCETPNNGNEKRQWWHLSNYFGVSGFFCPNCYEMVSHNSYRVPNHPEKYKMVRVALKLKGNIK